MSLKAERVADFIDRIRKNPDDPAIDLLAASLVGGALDDLARLARAQEEIARVLKIIASNGRR